MTKKLSKSRFTLFSQCWKRSETTFSAFLKWLFQGNSTMFGHNALILRLTNMELKGL